MRDPKSEITALIHRYAAAWYECSPSRYLDCFVDGGGNATCYLGGEVLRRDFCEYENYIRSRPLVDAVRRCVDIEDVFVENEALATARIVIHGLEDFGVCELMNFAQTPSGWRILHVASCVAATRSGAAVAAAGSGV